MAVVDQGVFLEPEVHACGRSSLSGLLPPHYAGPGEALAVELAVCP